MAKAKIACVVRGTEDSRTVMARNGRTITTFGFKTSRGFVTGSTTYPTVRAAKAVLGQITSNKKTR